jgi:hypothetical protein
MCSGTKKILMKKKILLFVLLAFLFGKESMSQAVIGISPYSVYIANDTLPAGATDSIAFYIVNSGTTPFSGSYTLHTSVQDSAGTFIFFPVDTVVKPAVTIAPGDSVPEYLNPYYLVAPSKYHYDINVIVIWPVAASASIGDSLLYVEVLTMPDGVNEISLDELIRAYPNPVSQELNLKNDSKISIEEVRIYDMRGRCINIIKNEETLCTGEWKAGTYLLNITTTDKRSCTIRVVKR